MFPTRILTVAALAGIVGCSGGGSSPGGGPPAAPTPPSSSNTATPTTVPATAGPGPATPTPAGQALTVTTASLSFTSSAAQTFLATEPGYAGALSVTSAAPTSCTGIATFSPAMATGQSAPITVMPIAAGLCIIVVADASGQRASVSIMVTTTAGTISSVGRSI
jgi:hypothetical protein